MRASWHSRLLGALATFFIFLTGSFVIWLLLLPTIELEAVYRAEIVILTAYTILGLITGSLNRNPLINRFSQIVHGLVAGLMLVAFIAWIIPLSPGIRDSLTMTPQRLGISVGLISALIFIARALPGSARPAKELDSLTDDQVLEFLQMEFLLLSENEVKELSARDGGLICPICTKSTMGNDWRGHWMRCRNESDPHFCHVWEFEYRNWMCPVCREPVFLAKENEDDGEDSGSAVPDEASKEA